MRSPWVRCQSDSKLSISERRRARGHCSIMFGEKWRQCDIQFWRVVSASSTTQLGPNVPWLIYIRQIYRRGNNVSGELIRLNVRKTVQQTYGFRKLSASKNKSLYRQLVEDYAYIYKVKFICLYSLLNTTFDHILGPYQTDWDFRELRNSGYPQVYPYTIKHETLPPRFQQHLWSNTMWNYSFHPYIGK